MNAEKDREIQKIKEEWIKETESIEPTISRPNTLDGAANNKRNIIAQKYIKRIRAVEKKYAKHLA